MAQTSIPVRPETRDRVRDLKKRGETYRSYDDLLEEMAEAYEQLQEN